MNYSYWKLDICSERFGTLAEARKFALSLCNDESMRKLLDGSDINHYMAGIIVSYVTMSLNVGKLRFSKIKPLKIIF